MSNVKVLKLANGDDIVAEVLSESMMEVQIKNPVQIVMVPGAKDGQGRQSPAIGLSVYSPYVNWEAGVGFRANQIVMCAEAVPELVEQYNAIFSKILQPTKSLLLPQ